MSVLLEDLIFVLFADFKSYISLMFKNLPTLKFDIWFNMVSLPRIIRLDHLIVLFEF